MKNTIILLLLLALVPKIASAELKAYCEFARCTDETVRFNESENAYWIEYSFRPPKQINFEATDVLQKAGLLGPKENVQNLTISANVVPHCNLPKKSLTTTEACEIGAGKLSFARYSTSNEFLGFSDLPISSLVIKQSPYPEGFPETILSIHFVYEQKEIRLGGDPVACLY